MFVYIYMYVKKTSVIDKFIKLYYFKYNAQA